MRFQVEILYILIRLHKENYALVRCGKKGELTSAISIQKGVRQGWVLAPTLFSLYINDLVNYLDVLGSHGRKIGGRKVPTLLFADNTLLISKTPSDLQTLVNRFLQFCKEKGLELNIQKTKFMPFNPYRSRECNIRAQDKVLGQVHEFDYLGVKCTSKLSWHAYTVRRSLKLQESRAILTMIQITKTRPLTPAVEV